LPVIITGHGSIETVVEPYKLEQEIASGHSFSRTSNQPSSCVSERSLEHREHHV